MIRYYTGVGSRKTPSKALADIKHLAYELAELGYVVRSGDAKGADKAFESGSKRAGVKPIIYTPNSDIPDWAFEEVKRHIPPGYPKLEDMKPYVQRILARNMMQVLGDDGKTPSEFLTCWTQAHIKNGGGTGWAMRCAKYHSIPVYNLKRGKAFSILHELIKKLKNG